jgi:hypothetical protein
LYHEKVPYFLEYINNMNKKIKDKNVIKSESSIIPHILEEIRVSNELLING